MRLAYDRPSRGLFIILADGRSTRSEDVAPGIVVDYDGAGKPVAIELEDVRGLVDEEALDQMTNPRIRTGEDLREYRERIGMSQEQLGQLLEIPRNTVARWERGEVAIEKRRMLELALRALLADVDVAVSELLNRIGKLRTASQAQTHETEGEESESSTPHNHR